LKLQRLQNKVLYTTLRSIQFGIPQGSIFNPLLILLHINDLPHHISSAEVVLFADNTNISLIDKNKVTLKN
jgi:hypothetical protein